MKFQLLTGLLLSSFYFSSFALAQIPMMNESFQLQRLIIQSEQQLKTLNEMLEQNRYDAASLQGMSDALNRLSAGINESIAPLRGERAYEMALLQIQSQDNFSQTYADAKAVRELPVVGRARAENRDDEGAFRSKMAFQRESVQANRADNEIQARLAQALIDSPPGVIQKIQAEIALGNWQTTTRLSAQLTEMIAAINTIREETRLTRVHQTDSVGLGTLIDGSEIQNRKQWSGGGK